MSFFRKKTRKSAPKRSTFISYVNFPTSETMATPTTANPANPTYENLLDKPNGAALPVVESDVPPPNTYVNLPPQTDSSPVKSKGASASSSHPKLSPQQSDPCISGTNPYSAVVQVEGGEFTVTPGHPQGMDEAKLRLLMPEEECVRCKELGQLLAMWELGVSGLARNYSKILSHLNKAKEASMVLECRVKQKAEMNSSMAESKNLQRSTRGFRQSVYGGLTSASAAEPNLAQQMYPKSQDQQPTPHEKQFNDLNTHLGEAIDVCQQLAAACFKSNQSSTGYSRLRRQPTMPNMPVTSRSTPTTSPHHRNILQSISEENPASSKRKHRKKPPLERTPSAPSDITSSTSSTMSQERTPEKGQAAKEDSESGSRQRAGSEETNAGTLTGESIVTDEMTTSKLLDSPTRSHGSPAKSHDSPIKSAPESPLKASNHSAAVPPAIPSVPDSGTGSMMELGNRDSILSTYSENDVKQVMSKLADLEEERLKLLETKEKMYHENQEVRQSLTEILADLASKDLQLTLAMQDLNIATREISIAVEMRENIAGLQSERDALLERLGNLEDESAAVKLSLIRLLQEKSATNKTLALENWRLNQRMRHMANTTLRRGSKSETPKGSAGAEGHGDNVSMTSQFSSNTEDATLQEAYMDFDVSGNFVHKQGFLVKQGAKVKSWKKRLFVLNTDGLSYYKTEQPIQMIPIKDIQQVQVFHGSRSPYPNMFQLHTTNRVFHLSAPSEDEMQSWVGMLQTLKQYNKVATLHRDAVLKAQLQEEHLPSSARDEVDHHQPLLQSHYPPTDEEAAHGQDVHLGSSFSDDDGTLMEKSDSIPVVKSVPVTRSGFVDTNERTDVDIIASLNLELS